MSCWAPRIQRPLSLPDELDDLLDRGRQAHADARDNELVKRWQEVAARITKEAEDRKNENDSLCAEVEKIRAAFNELKAAHDECMKMHDRCAEEAKRQAAIVSNLQEARTTDQQVIQGLQAEVAKLKLEVSNRPHVVTAPVHSTSKKHG